MRITGYTHIIILLQPQTLRKTLRRIFLAFVSKLLGARAQIRVVDCLQTFLPHRCQFLEFSAGQCLQIPACYCVQLAMHRQRVAFGCAVTDTRHSLLRYKPVVRHTVDYVIRAAARRKTAAVAILTYKVRGTIHHCLAHHKHLTQVILALTHTQQLALQESDGRKCPAGAGAVLILHRRDSHAVHHCEPETVNTVLYCRCIGRLIHNNQTCRLSRQTHAGKQTCNNQYFLHISLFTFISHKQHTCCIELTADAKKTAKIVPQIKKVPVVFANVKYFL